MVKTSSRPFPTVFIPTAPSTVPAPAAPPRRRNRRVFDMSSVRRSARLSSKRPLTQMQHAQRNMCRKLGILNELEPVEIALQEYVAMFSGPLPADIIAALTAIFNLEESVDTELDDALIGLAGEGVGDIQEADQAAT